MAAILPIPTSRVSDFLSSQRLVRQLQANQLDLFRIQSQLSTGRRVISPSDDAPAALRAMNLQRILERKSHAQTSLNDSISFLSATESAIGSVASTLNEIRSSALGVADSVSTHEARLAVVDQIDRAVQQLVAQGNSTFRERHLFSGSRAIQSPYAFHETFVEYRGNEGSLRSLVDVEFLFETNVPGSDVFGGLSEGLRGNVDLDPHANRATRVQDLNGGAGITEGAVEIVYIDAANKSQSAVVDISGTATLDDVARLLQAGVPEGSGITVEVTGTGLTLSTATAAEGVLVREVGEGRTALSLGIRSTTAQPTLVGDDITPALTKTTRLADLLGTKAHATLTSGGINNDLLITATRNGERVDPSDPSSDPLNGVTVQLVAGTTAGNESAIYDPAAATLTVTIEPGKTTASQVAAAINAEPSGLFIAAIDFRDSTSPTQAGQGAVGVSSTTVTAGGSGEVLDQASGLLVTNGGKTVAIDISAAHTVEDLLNILNRAELGLHAEINSAKNGINIRSRLSGADMTIGEVAGGKTATQLGVRSFHEATRLENFNRGVGVETRIGADLEIELDDGGGVTTFDVDLSNALTVGDVLELINTNTANLAAGGGSPIVEARLATAGKGIELVDRSGAAGPTTLTLRSVAGSKAAELLGFPAPDSSGTSSSTTTGVLTSEDRHTLEADSVFNTLLRLREALVNGDLPRIGREIERLDADLDRVNFARSEIGARLQTLDVLKTRHEDEVVSLRSALSLEIDVDLAEAISQFTGRQFALQATLQTSANLLQLSILNFL